MGDFTKIAYDENQPKEQKMNRKNWFELVKAMIMAGLGYLAGLFL